jgi:hypothetical protein
VCGYLTSYSYKTLSLSTISTQTPLDDLEDCSEQPWKTDDDEEDNENY